MRVSTSQMFYAGTSNMLDNQSALYKTQNQLATGRKNMTPRDNPVDASLALMTTQAKGMNANFMKNQAEASDRLAYVDTQLGAASDMLQDVIARSIQGGNSIYSSEQKQAIAEELKRRFDGLVDIANTKDGSGEYVFAGNRTQVQPFSVSGSGGNYDLAGTPRVSYNGDDGQRELQVGPAQTVSTGQSGQSVFMRVMGADGNLNGRSVFDALQNMIDVLDSSSGVTPAAGAYDQALADLQASLDHVSRTRATVGAEMNQMDMLTNASSDQAIQYDTRLSRLESLDYAEAISRLSQQQMQLQAAQQSFLKVSELRLFNLL
ncbi:MAG: flagellar hook-associated protein FlgL [Dechloromonas sp.]|nr:flagellar hook-associated protein FlgL [Dechloromonas sp.]